MRFNVTIESFTKEPEEQVKLCLETNTKTLSLFLHAHNDKLSYLTKADELFRNNNIEIVALHAPLDPGDLSSFEEGLRRDLIKNIIEEMKLFARFCPGKIVVVHPGELVESEAKAELQYALCKKSLKEIFEFAKILNLKVAVENMRHGDDRPAENFKFRIGENPKILVDIINSLGYDNTGICFDTGHANIAGDIIERLLACGDKLMHVHISDNFGIRDNHLIPGYGNINWKAFGDTLSKLNYKGAIELEIAKPKDKTPVEAILEAKKLLQKVLHELN